MECSEINTRYSKLAETESCLSCGGALNYAWPQPGEVCVDLGSGRGNDVILMAKAVGETGFVYGIDISEGMVEKARLNALASDVSNAAFIRCRLEKLELPDRAADLVISNCTLNHSDDKQRVWHEISRILKKGGRFVVSDIYAMEAIDNAYRNDPVAVAECWAGAVTRDEYLLHIRAAGFRAIEIVEESAPYFKGNAEIASFTVAGVLAV